MGSGLHFKWEDSQALKHHCGLCERPLNHPAARTSCFGTHAEPCHRFHQAMFMRLRSHTCAYCLTIDEAHWKRHKEIAEFLYHIYETCGEIDWPIIPSDPDERGRSRTLNSAADNGTDASSSKRERKDVKRLERASSRSRIITGDEINYIDSVLHAAEGLSNGGSEGPRNAQEIDEIEKHLRYHAQVYQNPARREELNSASQFDNSDNDVDFEVEIQRLLDTFRVSELIKRNSKNRGLQGKQLRLFVALFDELRKALIDDLVLVKKDTLEIRMRRAGYLRYINKTAYGIVEDRYSDKDWKTGEKLASSTSGSSGIASSAEEPKVSKSSQENSAPQQDVSSDQADLRHLESTHKRLNSEERSDGQFLDPYHTPLLPLLPNPGPSKKPMSLKILDPSGKHVNSNIRTPQIKNTLHFTNCDGWKTVSRTGKPTTMTIKPTWTSTPSARPSKPHSTRFNHSILDILQSNSVAHSQELGKNIRVQAPSVQAPDAAVKISSNIPEQFIAPFKPSNEAGHDQDTTSHPVISQKKAKKATREARRKAKKAIIEGAPDTNQSIITPVLEENIDDSNRIHPTMLTVSSIDDKLKEIDDSKDIIATRPAHEAVASPSSGLASSKASTSTAQDLSLMSAPTSQHGKHMNWTKFTRNFVVDQLTDPYIKAWPGCSHSASCAFEGNEVVDCPFHEPHCSCVDPMQDLCYLVLPGSPSYSCGPYNRLRGKKLLAQYENDSRTKGYLMLIDDDLVDYLLVESAVKQSHRAMGMMPQRLADEYADVDDGLPPGPAMEQEQRFELRFANVRHFAQIPSRKLLHELQRTKFERKGAKYMCYCHDYLPEIRDPANEVMCSHRDCAVTYFHKSCVRRLGVEKVSRWFCTVCEKKMKYKANQTLAAQALAALDIDNVPMEPKKINEWLGEATLKNVFGMPNQVYDVLKGEVKKLGDIFKDVKDLKDVRVTAVPLPVRFPMGTAHVGFSAPVRFGGESEDE